MPLNRPWSRTIIYEMHVAGFHASSKLQHSGREARYLRRLIEKIPYLQQLGITAVELLPVRVEVLRRDIVFFSGERDFRVRVFDVCCCGL